MYITSILPFMFFRVILNCVNCHLPIKINFFISRITTYFTLFYFIKDRYSSSHFLSTFSSCCSHTKPYFFPVSSFMISFKSNIVSSSFLFFNFKFSILSIKLSLLILDKLAIIASFLLMKNILYILA